MAVKLQFKSVRLTCPKHIRYNPSKEGQGGIKGGCPCCTFIYSAFDSLMKLDRTSRLALHETAAMRVASGL